MRSLGEARHLDGSGEVELATYKHFNTEDLLGEMALERMVAGLSTRNYSAGLEPVGLYPRRPSSPPWYCW
jgi:putative transposase